MLKSLNSLNHLILRRGSCPHQVVQARHRTRKASAVLPPRLRFGRGRRREVVHQEAYKDLVKQDKHLQPTRQSEEGPPRKEVKLVKWQNEKAEI